METPFTFTQPVSFGDCDPAGIVFYPNALRWVDATFHTFLKSFGGHAAICLRLGAVGLGVMEASVRFQSPMRDGDQLDLRLFIESWGRKTLTLAYEGHVRERLVFKANEVRGLFNPAEGGIAAGDIAGLREILEGNTDG